MQPLQNVMTLRVRGMAGCHNLGREVPQRKVSQKKKRSREGQVPERRLLCEVSDDCQAVLKTLLDREVRGRLITILRGKDEMLYRALCGPWSWVSRSEMCEPKVLEDGRGWRCPGQFHPQVTSSIIGDRINEKCVKNIPLPLQLVSSWRKE